MSMLRALLWTDPAICILTVFMGSISLLASIVDGTGHMQHRIARRWARMVMAVSGATVRVTGLDQLTPGAAYVFCSNHLSLIDTPLVFGYLPWEFRVLAKKIYFGVPFLGWHLRRAGHLPVEPDNVRASVRNVAEAARQAALGLSIVIFPEGGRSRTGALGEFHAGAAYIAIKAGAPVVPMGIVGTREVLPPGSIIVRPRPVELRIGAPIPTAGLTTRHAKDLLLELRRRIVELSGEPEPSARKEMPATKHSS
jgi:1-acyl-sn-glycerol-3-phosphate acyltransferase